VCECVCVCACVRVCVWTIITCVTFDILMAVTLKNTPFEEVTPCAVLVFISRFGEKSRQNYTTVYIVISQSISYFQLCEHTQVTHFLYLLSPPWKSDSPSACHRIFRHSQGTINCRNTRTCQRLSVNNQLNSVHNLRHYFLKVRFNIFQD
jgi:hypothetical protein